MYAADGSEGNNTEYLSIHSHYNCTFHYTFSGVDVSLTEGAPDASAVVQRSSFLMSTFSFSLLVSNCWKKPFINGTLSKLYFVTP